MDSHVGQHKRQRSDDLSTDAKRKRHEISRSLGLADLPEEVLLLMLDTILGAMIRCRDLQTVLRKVAALHSLSLTNRMLNRLATPYLCAFITNRNRRKLPQALDTMIMDPRKAERIRHISWALDVRRSSQAMCRRSPKAETMYLQKLGRLGIPELAGDLRQCFHGNSPEYHLATTLVLAPNLEYLEAADVNYEQETVEDITWRPTWLELLALKALSKPPGLARHFQNLRHLQLSMNELSFEQIAPLLSLPALRTLHFRGGEHNGQIEEHVWSKEVGKRCSAVETLIFELCWVSSQIVAQILDAIQCLKTLKLELNYWTSSAENDNESSEQQHSWPKLSEAVSAHKESLERLYLVDGGTDPRNDFGDGDVEGLVENKRPLYYEHMKCLQDLPKLRYLDTGFMAFPFDYSPKRASLDHMVLPSLEHLILRAEGTLTFAMDAFQISLQDLAADCRSRLPSLKDILVWLPENYDTTFMDFSVCQKALASEDIHLVILCYDDDKTRYTSSNKELGRESGWRLHPSTAEGTSKEPSMLNRGSWGCRLVKDANDRAFEDPGVQAVFHGPCSTYHDPYGWSIIDNA